MPDEFRKGLLGGLLSQLAAPSTEEDFISNAVREKIIRGELNLLRSSSPRGLFGQSFQHKFLAQEEILLDFAVNRRMSLEGDWRSRAIRVAAFEHPELTAGKRNRGRPPNKYLGGLLSRLAGPHHRGQELLQEITDIIRSHDEKGEAISQRRALEIYVLSRKPNEQPGSVSFKWEIDKLQTRLNVVRKALGIPLLPRGRKPAPRIKGSKKKD